MEIEPIITAEKLAIGYRDDSRHIRTVQEGLSFSLRKGELTCLLGTNGSGKSTLLHTISRSLPPLGGALRLAGKPIGSYRESEFSRTVGLVLTEKTAAGGLTVRELVSLGRYPYTGFFGRLGDDDRKAVETALAAVGMDRKAERQVAQLSDGERQKAFIAKSLAQECPVVLLDEPTAFLDVVSRIEIMHLLHTLAAEQGKTILLSTHDVEQALLLADRLWILQEAGGMACGATEDLIFSNRLEEAFSRNEIRFDRNNGSFRPQPLSAGQIRIVANGALLFWTRNALTRNGLGYTESESADCTVRIEAPNAITVERIGREPQRADSFETLLALLKRR